MPTLSELKAENAAKENETVEEETLETEEVIENLEEAEEPTEEDNTEEDNEESETDELEDWQKEESEEDSKKTGFVPNAGAKVLRLKNKALKNELSEQNSELESLKAEIESLKQGNQPQTQELKRPKLEDFDFDEARYNEAMDSYYDQKMDQKLSTAQQSNQQVIQQQRAQQKQEEAVTQHYTEAEKLLSEGKITEEKWMNGDKAIRQTLDLVANGAGNQLADQLIAVMNSNGSDAAAKAWYYIGQNPSALVKLRDTLSNDPSGLQAVAYLSQLQAKASKPSKRKHSKAPPPAAKVKGDAAAKVTTLKKAYDKAEGDVQARISLKRQAKAKGEDVSKW